MKLIKQSHKIINITPDPYKQIEYAARTCYNSHDKITDTSAPRMVTSLIKRTHMAMIEFADITVEFITDRTVSHELVRHRLTSPAQASQRYINYSDGVSFILPPWLDLSTYQGEWGSYLGPTKRLEALLRDPKEINIEPDSSTYVYLKSLYLAEEAYMKLTQKGWQPEQARKVLPGSCATTIILKANFREWMHILSLRFHGTTGRPDPTMHTLMQPLHQELSTLFPEVFRNEEE